MCACYQRDDEQNVIVGIVEVMGTQEQKLFKIREELLTILHSAEITDTGLSYQEVNDGGIILKRP